LVWIKFVSSLARVAPEMNERLAGAVSRPFPAVESVALWKASDSGRATRVTRASGSSQSSRFDSSDIVADHWNWLTTVGAGLLLMSLLVLSLAFAARVCVATRISEC
jgi:hypothetical protein